MSQARFIGEPITVEYDQPPLLQKTPRCPDRICWGDDVLPIVELLAEWQDFRRRGRMAQNMRPGRIGRARQKGSWGVGRFFFRVRLADGRIFDIYYDRAPQGSDHRAGRWAIYQQQADDGL